MVKSLKYLVKSSSMSSKFELGYFSPAEEYCIQNYDLYDVIVISISGKNVLTEPRVG